MIEDELLVVHFFRSAKRALWGAVLLFSFIVTAVYIPLILYWAPQSYWVGKRALLHLAKKQFFQYEANQFHTPFPGVTFFFKRKNIERNVLHFSTIFLAFNNRHGERYLFTAQWGTLKNNYLYLHHGSVYTVNVGKHYFATFEQSEINLCKIFNLEKDLLQGYQARFLTIGDLWNRNNNQEVSYEFHKRIALILWLLLFPLLAFMNILTCRWRKSNLLLGVFFNGLLFLLSYVSMSLAHVMWTHFFSACIFLYAVILGVFVLMLSFYFKKFS
jgi:lipopolysaccharide export LptBFGC system permease protein LptF